MSDIIRGSDGSYGSKMLPIDLPSNSNKSKQQSDKRVSKKKVISGSVTRKKKKLSTKIKESFISEDAASIKSYIFDDVVIPTIKDIIFDVIKGSLEMILYPGSKRTRSKRESKGTYVNYGAFYGSNRREDRRESRKCIDVDDLIFGSHGDAEEVLSQLVDCIEDYGEASVADLKEYVGEPSDFTDNKYGWTNLSSARVVRVRDGYSLNLPKAIILD